MYTGNDYLVCDHAFFQSKSLQVYVGIHQVVGENCDVNCITIYFLLFSGLLHSGHKDDDGVSGAGCSTGNSHFFSFHVRHFFSSHVHLYP